MYYKYKKRKSLTFALLKVTQAKESFFGTKEEKRKVFFIHLLLLRLQLSSNSTDIRKDPPTHENLSLLIRKG